MQTPENIVEDALPASQPRPLPGNKYIGQDILSELIYASRVSLTIGFLAGLISVLIGATLGMLAGYYRGMVEELVMATGDVVLLIPGLRPISSSPLIFPPAYGT